MTRPAALEAFYDGWRDQQAKLLASIRPLTLEQMQLRAAPGEWAIWQLASNMAGARLYWLCGRLGGDDGGLWERFRDGGWGEIEGRPRSAQEIDDVFLRTWGVIEEWLDRWTLDDLTRERTNTDASGRVRTITPSWVITSLFGHEVHHGSEASLPAHPWATDGDQPLTASIVCHLSAPQPGAALPTRRRISVLSVPRWFNSNPVCSHTCLVLPPSRPSMTAGPTSSRGSSHPSDR